MRMLLVPLVAALAACGNRPGTATARWVGAGVDELVEHAATAGWCAESRIVLLEVGADDRIAGVTWRYDSLVPQSFAVAPPAEPDSAGATATVGARDVHLDEVRGYRGLAGTVRVTAVDSSTISATVEATLQRVGQTDTARFSARFNQIPLSRDETLCRP